MSNEAAASARLCVETNPLLLFARVNMQPPPRGCVLKLRLSDNIPISAEAAASARLCVETRQRQAKHRLMPAAASARLCVETRHSIVRGGYTTAAASARLCVETF